MSKKKSFVLRINEETWAALEKWAADEFRSVNGHLEWMITNSLRKNGRLPKKSKSRDKENLETLD